MRETERMGRMERLQTVKIRWTKSTYRVGTGERHTYDMAMIVRAQHVGFCIE